MAKKILLADDSITIQKVISITFASEDYELVVVGDGDSAIAKAREVRPDLIMADVAMPGKTGYEVCSAVKQDAALKGTPVLLLAGTFEPLNKDEALKAGADDSIVKPFESQELLDKVKELLSRVSAPSEAAKAPAQPSKLEIATDIWDSGDFIGFTEEFEEKKEEGKAPDLSFLEEDHFEGGRKELSAETDFTDLVIHEEEFHRPAEKAPAKKVELPVEPFGGKKAEGYEVEPFGAEPFKTETAVESEPFGKAFWTETPSAAPEEKEQIAEPDLLEIPEEVIDTAPVRPFERPAAEPTKPLREIMETASPRAEAAPVSPVSDDLVRQTLERIAEKVEARLIEDLNLKLGRSESKVNEAIEKAAARLESRFASDLNAKLQRAEAQARESVEKAAARAEEKLSGELASRLEKSLSVPKDQMEAIVARTAKEVIEQVAWEVIPELAEQLIRAEINKVKEAIIRLK